MTCVEIVEIKTNIDQHKAAQEKPAKCKFEDGDDDACKYYFKDKAGASKLLFKEYCECSLMEEKEDGVEDYETYILPYQQLEKFNMSSIPRTRIEKGVGFCPLPPQKEILRYVYNMKQIKAKSVTTLHTNDRNNFKAMSEMMYSIQQNYESGTQERNQLKQLWKEIVNVNFEIEFWPFI